MLKCIDCGLDVVNDWIFGPVEWLMYRGSVMSSWCGLGLASRTADEGEARVCVELFFPLPFVCLFLSLIFFYIH